MKAGIVDESKCKHAQAIGHTPCSERQGITLGGVDLPLVRVGAHAHLEHVVPLLEVGRRLHLGYA